ncbi:cell wall assembly regulator SMI1 [Winogradskyella pacifica]|uniref:Cell wall assembly regulator SMI1 n=1 Tax=Winogradskyella pacifica TaxID=664642 RepID=A0A3D9LQC5_9FLAO|nr:SMI1/KNR4 family protein [Winogradskyella pacifica]REE08163.1 cell wall assembly regulator SMI1 [Winogradskyella pacifica]
MTNYTAYSDEFKDLQWTDFIFETIQIDTFPVLENPKHHSNSFTFRDTLLDAVAKLSGKPLLKLIFITPDYETIHKFYAVGYLEDKTVFTVEIEHTAEFKAWFTVIHDEHYKSATVYNFRENGFSSHPTSNLKDIRFLEHTGAFINYFIPNQFIAEQLAKEKSDFLAPHIQLDAEIDMKALVASFIGLISEKKLTLHPPTNNEAIYETFEKEAGYPFPQIIKDYLSLHNGIDRCAIMGTEDIYNEWKQWKDIYDDWTQEDLLDTYSTNQGKALLMYTTPYWIPFFDLENGNFIAFDFAPNTKGKAGQIIRFGADQEIGYIEANDLVSFFESLRGPESEIEDNEWFYIAQ